MNLKGNKAITLVALIITIIVLLILAGVTLNMVLGENGLINKAQSSVDKYQQSSVNEQKLLNSIEEYFDSNVQRDKKLTLSATSGTCTYPNPLSFTVTNNSSGGTITAISSDTSVAEVSVDRNTITVTPRGVGSATILVKRAPTGDYNEATATYEVKVIVPVESGVATNISNYGRTVSNYSVDGSDEWVLLYQDKSSVYLRKKDNFYLHIEGERNESLLTDPYVGSICDELFPDFAPHRNSIDPTKPGYMITARFLDSRNWDGTNLSNDTTNPNYYNFSDPSKRDMIRYITGTVPYTVYKMLMMATYDPVPTITETKTESESWMTARAFSYYHCDDPSKNTETPNNYEDVRWIFGYQHMFIIIHPAYMGYMGVNGSGGPGYSSAEGSFGLSSYNGSYGSSISVLPMVCLDVDKFTPIFK